MIKTDFNLELEKIHPDRALHIAVITAEWNSEITSSLKKRCIDTLVENGIQAKDITEVSVPGAFELSTAAAVLAAHKHIDAVICLGCVIQGETRHFEFICNAVANGITSVGISYLKPVVFGVLTTDNMQQAQARSGSDNANKGFEAAVSALKMLGSLHPYYQHASQVNI
ncbi:MAG: 6,7-dimethyl-8-ribityllumazine synthase [Bacteroidales bacterium]|jgi:6,7-dimethyl-8-ribityllumazine synthase|nr:6,7-dimethyl-8-ribityllumazine synthase [Bacteroidales bacterium]